MISYLRRKAISETKPIRLKLYFRRGYDYIKVYVWKTRGDMIAGTGRYGDKFIACYFPEEYKKSRKNHDLKIGTVHFFEGRLNESVVSHEFLHAVFDLAYKLGKNITPPSPDENHRSKNSKYCEYLCYELDRLVKSFWVKYRNKSR